MLIFHFPRYKLAGFGAPDLQCDPSWRVRREVQNSFGRVLWGLQRGSIPSGKEKNHVFLSPKSGVFCFPRRYGGPKITLQRSFFSAQFPIIERARASFLSLPIAAHIEIRVSRNAICPARCVLGGAKVVLLGLERPEYQLNTPPRIYVTVFTDIPDLRGDF